MLSQLINTGDERAELQAALRWDYSQLGDAAATVIEHTIEIKRNERRANDAVVAAGRHLIAVKETLAHGQWGDWLDTEFNMSDRTARTLMSIAERFDGKTEMISDLSVTVLGLLAAPSTPDAAVDAVIAANQQQPVRVADVKAIIADHKPTVDPWQYAATANGSRQKRIEYMAGAIRPWIETYIDDYGRNWRAIDARGNVAHTNSLLWTDITREAQRRNAISISEDILKEAIKLAFAWLRAAAAPSTINNLPPKEETGDPSRTLDRFVRQDALDNAPDPAPRPSPLAPSPYKSLAQMDADGDIPPLAPRPSQPDTYSPVHPLQTALRSLLATYTAADLRTTANYRGGSRWFEARRLLAAAGIHYRDRDLVQALNNLADELEQRDRTQPAQPSIPSTPSIPSAPSPEPDDRINRARILINHYAELCDACERALEREPEYEALIGTPSDLLAAHRGMHAIVETLTEPIAKLQHLVETLIATRYESR